MVNALKKHRRLFFFAGSFTVLMIFIFSITIGVWYQQQSGNCAGSQGGGPATGQTANGNDRQLAQAGWKQFKADGYSDAAAAGALGNLQYESGGHFNVHEEEIGGGGGYGLPQFTKSTLTQARQIAQQQHFNFDTVEGQIQTLDYSCLHDGQWMPNDGKSYDQFKHMTDPSEAAASFLHDYERPKVPALAARQQDAKQWYAAFAKGNDKTTGEAKDFAATNSNGAQGDDGDCNAADGTPGAGSDIVSQARAWMGWFHYGQVHPSPTLGSDLKNPNKNGITDCSGFVWLVLNKCGYKVPPRMGWFTGTMAADAKGPHHWLKQVDQKNAKAGDIIIVNQGNGAGDNGHTAILAENWHGYATKCINEGGSGGSGGVNENTVQNNFGYLLNGGDVVLAEPIK